MASEARYGDVEAIASELGEAIADLPEYEAYQAAERAVQASEPAQAQIDAFESARERFMLQRQLGEATQDDVEALKSLQSELHALPVMQEYLAAQTALDERLAAVNEAISEGIDIDFAGQAGACCHD